MSATRPRVCAHRNLQVGTTAVEFAVVVLVFLVIVCGVIEVARAMYVINILPEVTRRAARNAAHTDFRSPSALAAVRADAVLRDTAGPLLLGDPVTDANVIIDYLWISRAADGTLGLNRVPTGALPSCPASNRQNCLSDPYASNCVQLVRARICQRDDGDACAPLRYKLLLPLIDLPIQLPISTTIVPAGSFGLAEGVLPCT